VQFSEETMAGKEKHQAQLVKFQMEMRARTIVAPTNDHDVKMQLRRFLEPICLFGEGPSERRDRLKIKLAKMEVEQGVSASEILKGEDGAKMAVPALEDRTEAFFTEGGEKLKAARLWALEYSLPRARDRLHQAKRKQSMLEEYLEAKEKRMKQHEAYAKTGEGEAPDPSAPVLGEDNEIEAEHMQFVDKAGRYRNMDLTSSQVGDVRPISGCSFSSDGQTVATCSWSGAAKLWRVPDCDEAKVIYAHRERLSDVQFCPSFKSGSLGDASLGDSVCLATSSADATIKMWSSGSFKEMACLKGHLERVCRIAWHPSSRLLGSTSYDRTWRLWDVETSQELLCQEGHSRAVYTVAFQGDGALVATAGLDSYGRIWDLRTGYGPLNL
jgi:U4/U6 small nuclear ribonucleoprotein PRP4